MQSRSELIDRARTPIKIWAGVRATSSGKLADSENSEKIATFVHIYGKVFD